MVVVVVVVVGVNRNSRGRREQVEKSLERADGGCCG